MALSGYSTGPGWKVMVIIIGIIMEIMIRTKQENYEKILNLKSLVIAPGQVGKRT